MRTRSLRGTVRSGGLVALLALVFIEISDDKVAVHPAEEFWGLDCYEAEERLIERVGVKNAHACVIGPAGEKLVRFACIQNNRTHSLGRGGCGAVMGSKNLKAWESMASP